MSWRRHIVASLAATAVAALFGLGIAVPAQADDRLDVAVAGGGPLIELVDIAPGSSGSGVLTVTNRSDDAGRLTLRIVDLVDDDNGCRQPEVRSGDVTCGPDGGELSRDLHLSVRPASTVETDASWPTGSLRDLSRAPVATPIVLGAGQSIDVAVDWTFDRRSGNETQTDRVAFDLVVGLDMETDGVAGAVRQRGPAVQVAGVQLPRTGSAWAWMAPIGVLLAAAGSGLVLTAHRGSRR